MTKEAEMTTQSKTTPKAEAVKAAASESAPAEPESAPAEERPAPPAKSGEEFRQEWAEANGVDPSEMREIHYPGGWIDRFDGRGWVQEGGY